MKQKNHRPNQYSMLYCCCCYCRNTVVVIVLMLVVGGHLPCDHPDPSSCRCLYHQHHQK